MNDIITILETDKSIILAKHTPGSQLGEYTIRKYTDKTNRLKETTDQDFGSWADITLYYTIAPTGNCQFGSLAYASNVLNTEEIAREFFDGFRKTTLRKPMLFMDVYKAREGVADIVFKDNIVIKAPYISTNKSDMILYLVKL